MATEGAGQGHQSKALAAGGMQSQCSFPRLGFHLIVRRDLAKDQLVDGGTFPRSLGAEYAVRSFLNSLVFCFLCVSPNPSIHGKDL